ncbi:uncharacterized protein F5147DRAFT_833607, partial [Suillus discolor]
MNVPYATQNVIAAIQIVSVSVIAAGTTHHASCTTTPAYSRHIQFDFQSTVTVPSTHTLTLNLSQNPNALRDAIHRR